MDTEKKTTAKAKTATKKADENVKEIKTDAKPKVAKTAKTAAPADK